MPRKSEAKEKLVKNINAPTVTSYFKVGDIVLMGKFKNTRGKVVGFGEDKWGNPTIEIEPTPKGRKKNRVIGLFKIWRADVKGR